MSGHIVFATAEAAVPVIEPAGAEIGDDVIEEGSVGLVVWHNAFDGDATVLVGTEDELQAFIDRAGRVLDEKRRAAGGGRAS